MDASSIAVLEQSDADAALCKFLEVVLLQTKARREIERKRQFMRDTVLETLGQLSIQAQETVKLEAEKNRLVLDTNLEESLDEQIGILKGLSATPIHQAIDNLGMAAMRSVGYLTTNKVDMSQVDQVDLQSNLMAVDRTLVALGKAIDSDHVQRASNSKQLIDSCLKREANVFANLKTLGSQVKSLTEENSLLVSCAAIDHRASSMNEIE